MPDVAQVLSANKIEFRRNNTTVDALNVNPALVAEIGRIMARNPQEVFMFADQPQGAPAPVMYVNKITDTKITPFTGEPAITLAQQILQREAQQKALVSSLTSFRAAAKDKIKYAAGYGPPPTAATAPAAAPAAAPAKSATPAS